MDVRTHKSLGVDHFKCMHAFLIQRMGSLLQRTYLYLYVIQSHELTITAFILITILCTHMRVMIQSAPKSTINLHVVHILVFLA